MSTLLLLGRLVGAVDSKAWKAAADATPTSMLLHIDGHQRDPRRCCMNTFDGLNMDPALTSQGGTRRGWPS